MRTLLVSGMVIGSIAGVASVSQAATPTDYEQYALQLINRARANPNAEVTRLSSQTWGDDPSQVPGTQFPKPQTANLNEGLPANTISAAAKAPLAFNVNLIQSARDYSNTLLTNNSVLDHNFGGTTPDSRAQAAGYNGTASENLSIQQSTVTLPTTQGLLDAMHNGLFVDNNTVGRGHRKNLMNTTSVEIGVGIASSATYAPGGDHSFPNAVLLTEDLGNPTSAGPFLTGVVFNDNAHTGFYAPSGEGIGGATIRATAIAGGATAQTTTWSSGGYSLQLLPGTYTITAAGAFGTAPLGTVTISTANVEVDAINPTPEPSSLSLVLLGTVGLLRRRRVARGL